MPVTYLRQTVSTAALLLAACAIAPAQGQVQVQDGSALDANQQVGSGGFNRPGEQIDFRARNLIVTGNVAGGRAFQGSVGFNADGAFQGSLGSDSLFNFRRDSILSSPAAANLNFNSRRFGDRIIFGRPSDNINGFRGGNGIGSPAAFDPGSGALTFRQNGGGLFAIAGVDNLQNLRNAGSSLGLVQTPTGLVNVNASPLTGIRFNPLDANLRDPIQFDNDQPEPVVPDQDDIENDSDRTGLTSGENARLSLQRDLRVQPTSRGDLTQDELAELRLRQDPLAITLGTQVQSQLALQLAGQTSTNLPNSLATSLRERVFGKQGQADPNQPPTAPKNPYDKLIADILANAQGEETDAQDDAPAEEAGDVPAWRSVLESPEQTILKAKMDAREMAIRISLNMVDEEGNIDFETELPTIDPASEIGKLLNDLSYDLPRVRTLAGEDTNRVNKLLSRGEQELQAERYIIAENIYRQVLREKQDDPLALAGLVHSQMGAGMIRSAAFNLRGLFANNPELIALRYDEQLMPSNERLRWLQNRLQKMIGENIRGADPGLVLAYLGYQLEAKPLVEFGLAVAEAEAPRDPLMPVLRKIWIEGKSDQANDADDQAAPAQDPAK